MQLKSGTSLQNGRYTITATLGQGGFGITYLATQKGLNRQVAIKEFFIKEYCNRDETTSHISVPSEGAHILVERFRQKFLKEARTIAELDNAHIIRIYDVFEENGTAYYVMEYINEGSLRDYVKQHGPLPENEAITYIYQLSDALQYLHAHKILHLDLKPANVLLKADNTAVLIDFGISKRYDEQGGQTSSTPVGISKGYAPLEQYNMDGVSHFQPCTDIYSLGATFYTLLTNEVPPSATEVNNEGLPALPTHISAAINNVIQKAMSPRPKDRPQTMKDFLELLAVDTKSEQETTDDEDTIIVQSTSSSKTENDENIKIVEVQSSPKSRNRKLWIIGVISLLVIGILIFSQKEEQSSIEMANWIPESTNATTSATGTAGVSEESASHEETAMNTESLNKPQSKVEAESSPTPQQTTQQVTKKKHYQFRQTHFREGLAWVALNGKYGYIDENWNEVIPLKYDEARPFWDVLAAVKLNGKWGYINKKGEEVIPILYDEAGDFNDGLAVVKLHGKYGCLDISGKEVIPMSYKGFRDFSEGLAAVCLNDKWGYIDAKGNIIVPMKYTYAQKFQEGLANIALNNKRGFIDKCGNVVIPVIYEGSRDFKEGLAPVCYNGKWGYVNKKGEEVIPFKFDSADVFYSGKALVRIGNDNFHIDKQGNRI